MMQTMNPNYTLHIELNDAVPLQYGANQAGTGQLAGHVIGQTAPTRKFYSDTKVGCDEVLAAVRKALGDAGLAARVSFERFEWK